MPRILLVEDDPYLRRALRTKLTKHGFDLTETDDGEMALRELQQNHFDLVLLDLILPKVQGFEILRQIRADELTADLPVMVLSNLGQDADIKKAEELGVSGYLIKANHSLNDLVHRVENVFKKAPVQ
jgi:DNA-binding response OmpR family regulator